MRNPMGLRSWVQGGAALVCIGGVIYAIATNPGVADAQLHFTVMRADMAALLQHGGRVASQSEGAKYGSAFVVRTLWDEGWSRALMQDYEAELASRGWRMRNGFELEYCKSGMLARIVPHSGVMNSQGTNALVIEYNAATVRNCAN